MRIKVLASVTVLLLVLVGSASAWAPMGAPTSDLKQSQFRVGFDYAYSSIDLDVDFDGTVLSADSVKTNMFVANIGYGLLNDWETFIRLGAANAEADYGFALGFGTKVTIIRKEKLGLGALFQASWFSSDDTVEGMDATLKVHEIQFAMGPTYKLTDTISVFGGPFVHFIGGKVDVKDGGTFGVNEDSAIGGYIGVEAQICPHTSLYGEAQLADGEWAFGSGISWKF